ncbi:macrolide ABC transporter ATP-binding protein [Methylophilaceae bacterium]|nr:macrolide ABC transporter ATP-binding protein [Methylophilaceae bacterium]
MTNNVIEITGLYKDYDTPAGVFPVLKDVNLTIEAGDYVAIMGPSGSGKSTFMNILGCLDRPTKGEYKLNNQSVKSLNNNQLAALRNRTIGFVFQGFNLLARSSLVDNVALPLVYAKDQKELRTKIAKNILERMGLGQYFESRPNQISGGQQQRVAIARALVNQPRIILADEPTGNLDSKTSDEIMKIFDELNQIGNTIIIVTHENAIADHARRQIRFLDGKIVEDHRNKKELEKA